MRWSLAILTPAALALAQEPSAASVGEISLATEQDAPLRPTGWVPPELPFGPIPVVHPTTAASPSQAQPATVSSPEAALTLAPIAPAVPLSPAAPVTPASPTAPVAPLSPLNPAASAASQQSPAVGAQPKGYAPIPPQYAQPYPYGGKGPYGPLPAFAPGQFPQDPYGPYPQYAPYPQYTPGQYAPGFNGGPAPKFPSQQAYPNGPYIQWIPVAVYPDTPAGQFTHAVLGQSQGQPLGAAIPSPSASQPVPAAPIAPTTAAAQSPTPSPTTQSIALSTPVGTPEPQPEPIVIPPVVIPAPSPATPLASATASPLLSPTPSPIPIPVPVPAPAPVPAILPSPVASPAAPLDMPEMPPMPDLTPNQPKPVLQNTPAPAPPVQPLPVPVPLPALPPAASPATTAYNPPALPIASPVAPPPGPIDGSPSPLRPGINLPTYPVNPYYPKGTARPRPAFPLPLFGNPRPSPKPKKPYTYAGQSSLGNPNSVAVPPLGPAGPAQPSSYLTQEPSVPELAVPTPGAYPTEAPAPAPSAQTEPRPRPLRPRPGRPANPFGPGLSAAAVCGPQQACPRGQFCFDPVQGGVVYASQAKTGGHCFNKVCKDDTTCPLGQVCADGHCALKSLECSTLPGRQNPCPDQPGWECADESWVFGLTPGHCIWKPQAAAGPKSQPGDAAPSLLGPLEALQDGFDADSVPSLGTFLSGILRGDRLAPAAQ